MNYVKEMLKGILIGVANIMPGVSGSALAISMGIYDTILNAITDIVKDTRKSVKILLPYILGAAFGVAGLTFVIEYLFTAYPFQTSMVFVGLILGGFPMVLARVRKSKVPFTGYAGFLIMLCAALAMAIFGLGSGQDVQLTFSVSHIIILFFLGILGAATMIVPGVSGTMILMMLGYYRPILAAINRFLLSAGHLDFNGMVGEGVILLPFGLGLLYGFFVCAKAIQWLFDKYEAVTYCSILGLVVSSPIVIIMGIPTGSTGMLGIVAGVVLLAVSFTAAMWLGHDS